MYSVITTVTEFTVTSRVCAVDRSTFFRRANFLCLCLDALLDVPPLLLPVRFILAVDEEDEELFEPGLW